MNLEKPKRKLKRRGVILSEQGLFINIPRIFSVPPDEDGCVLEVHFELPATFPILSFDARREIERNLKKTLTGYCIDVYALSKLTRVGTKFQQKTVLGRNVYVDFGYQSGEDNWNWSLLSFGVHEAVILKEFRRLTTCEIFWTDKVNRIPDRIVPATINYVITTINDAETPIYHTNVIKKFKTYNRVHINVHRHKIYKRKRNESASSIAEAIAEGRTPKERYRTYKGLQLVGVGIHFPLDETNSFHFVFAERER